MVTPISISFDKVARLRKSPLAGIEEAYCQRLSTHGYAQGTQQQYINCVAHFATWMQVNKIPISEFGPDLIVRFVEKHLPDCQCAGRVQRHPAQVRAALQQLIPVLLNAGHDTNVTARDNLQVELDHFYAYLRDQRGLAINTCNQRRLIIAGLLRNSLDDKRRLRPIDATLLRTFISAQLERWSPSSAAVMAGALRSYLRYRALHGDNVATLLPVVASPACWRLAPLPQILSCEEVERVLNSFAAPVPSWRRGAAVTQCVARLGLRSREVVTLELEDINWESGTIRLRHCKSRRVDVMPLPEAVGAALAEYLCDERPACKSRRVFVRHVAPVEAPLQASLAGRVIRDAYLRCGLPYTRIHIFRHSLAARVLDSGGTLKEVADILRHRSLDTSQIYAKVDVRRLSAVAMPWPRSAP
jgi:site-specific recombinase XerD